MTKSPIKALHFLPDEYKLTVVGDGPVKEQLEELSVRLKLAERVRFEGAQADVVKYYTNAHLFFLPSIYEPFGQTILEASSCGVPTVAFNQNIVDTATKDILGNLGCYANELSPKSFANAILEAYDDFYLFSKRSRKEVRELVKTNYSWSSLYAFISR